jgi:putative oxidoreductase
MTKEESMDTGILQSTSLGILLIRVLFGVAIAAHGSQKLFGWFGGYGPKGTGGFFETLGFRPGVMFAAIAGLSEFVGGLLMTIGLFTPLGAAMVLAAMIVAIVSVHLKNGFFASNNGIEMPFLYAAAAVGVAFTGGGAYSVDALLDIMLFAHPYVVGALLVLTIISAALTLALRTHDQPQTAAPQRVK